MRIHTFTTWQLNDDGTWTLLRDEGYDYIGPTALAKKGRKKATRAAERAEAREKEQDRIRAEAEAVQKENRARSDAIASQYEATGPGEISPSAQAEYGSQLENIINTYRGLREAGMRATAQRGFGRAPSGFEASMRNTLSEGEAGATGDAYKDALARTEEGRRIALGYRTGQQQFYDPTERNLAAGNLGEQTGGAYERVGRMGNTFSDVLGGISTLAGIAIPAVGLAQSFGKAAGTAAGQMAGGFRRIGVTNTGTLAQQNPYSR